LDDKIPRSQWGKREKKTKILGGEANRAFFLYHANPAFERCREKRNPERFKTNSAESHSMTESAERKNREGKSDRYKLLAFQRLMVAQTESGCRLYPRPGQGGKLGGGNSAIEKKKEKGCKNQDPFCWCSTANEQMRRIGGVGGPSNFLTREAARRNRVAKDRRCTLRNRCNRG